MLLSIALPDKLPKSLIAFQYLKYCIFQKNLLRAISCKWPNSPDHQSIFFTFNICSMTKIKVQSNLFVVIYRSSQKRTIPQKADDPKWRNQTIFLADDLMGESGRFYESRRFFFMARYFLFRKVTFGKRIRSRDSTDENSL